MGHGRAGIHHAPARLVRARATGPGCRHRKIVDERPLEAEEIESIDVRLPAFLEQSKPFHHPQTGLEGKYSVEYDMAAMVLDGRAGCTSTPTRRSGAPRHRS